jgi:hypothetical protein
LRYILFAFALLANLLAYIPYSPAVAQERIILKATSDQGTFLVEMTWTPEDIGRKNAFDIRFIEPETGEEIEDVLYDISIHRGGDREILRRDQTATMQEFTFDEPGSYEIRVDDIEDLGESVTIPLQVTPEFPPGTIALASAAIGATIFAAWRNSNNLFSKQSN